MVIASTFTLVRRLGMLLDPWANRGTPDSPANSIVYLCFARFRRVHFRVARYDTQALCFYLGCSTFCFAIPNSIYPTCIEGRFPEGSRYRQSSHSWNDMVPFRFARLCNLPSSRAIQAGPRSAAMQDPWLGSGQCTS